jgi:hypothetical protein
MAQSSGRRRKANPSAMVAPHKIGAIGKKQAIAIGLAVELIRQHTQIASNALI